MVHDIKIFPAYFDQIISGDKTFEIRYNDRDYKIGDVLRLHSKEYIKRVTSVRVKYIFSDFGLLPGWVVMGITII